MIGNMLNSIKITLLHLLCLSELNHIKTNGFSPFFEGLIPEGWLLDIASKNWKINKNDRMGLLLACCQNCIGAVSVMPL
jgi:HipA-like protein